MADGLEMANSSNDSDVIILFSNDEMTGSSSDDDEKVSDDDEKVSDGDENVSDGDEKVSDDDKKVSDGDENVSDDDKNVSDDDDEMSGPPSDIILVDEDIAGTLIKRNSTFKFREDNNMVENSNDRKNVMYLSAEELSEMLNNNRNPRCHKVGTIKKLSSSKFLENDMVKTSNERKNIVELSSCELPEILNNNGNAKKLSEKIFSRSFKVSENAIELLSEDMSETTYDKKNVMKRNDHEMTGVLNNSGNVKSGCTDNRKNKMKFPSDATSRTRQNINKLPNDVDAGCSNISKSSHYACITGSLNDSKNVIKSCNDFISGSSKDNTKNVKKLPNDCPGSCIAESPNNRTNKIIELPQDKIAGCFKDSKSNNLSDEEIAIISHVRNIIKLSQDQGYSNYKENTIKLPNNTTADKNLSDDEMSVISNVSGIAIDLSDDGMSGVSNVSGVAIDISDDNLSGTSNVSGVIIDLSDDEMSADDEKSSKASKSLTEFEIMSEEEEPGCLTTQEIVDCYKQVKEAMKRATIKFDDGMPLDSSKKPSNCIPPVQEKITKMTSSESVQSILKKELENWIRTVRKESSTISYSRIKTVRKESSTISDSWIKTVRKKLSTIYGRNLSQNHSLQSTKKFSTVSKNAQSSSRHVTWDSLTKKHEITPIPEQWMEIDVECSSEYKAPECSPPDKCKVATVSSSENVGSTSKNVSKNRKSICGPLSFKIARSKEVGEWTVLEHPSSNGTLLVEEKSTVVDCPNVPSIIQSGSLNSIPPVEDKITSVSVNQDTPSTSRNVGQWMEIDDDCSSEYEAPECSPPVKHKVATVSTSENIGSTSKNVTKNRKSKCGPLSFKIARSKEVGEWTVLEHPSSNGTLLVEDKSTVVDCPNVSTTINSGSLNSIPPAEDKITTVSVNQNASTTSRNVGQWMEIDEECSSEYKAPRLPVKHKDATVPSSENVGSASKNVSKNRKSSNYGPLSFKIARSKQTGENKLLKHPSSNGALLVEEKSTVIDYPNVSSTIQRGFPNSIHPVEDKITTVSSNQNTQSPSRNSGQNRGLKIEREHTTVTVKKPSSTQKCNSQILTQENTTVSVDTSCSSKHVTPVCILPHSTKNRTNYNQSSLTLNAAQNGKTRISQETITISDDDESPLENQSENCNTQIRMEISDGVNVPSSSQNVRLHCNVQSSNRNLTLNDNAPIKQETKFDANKTQDGKTRKLQDIITISDDENTSSLTENQLPNCLTSPKKGVTVVYGGVSKQPSSEDVMPYWILSSPRNAKPESMEQFKRVFDYENTYSLKNHSQNYKLPIKQKTTARLDGGSGLFTSRNVTSNCNLPTNHGENQTSSSRNRTSNCNLPINHGENQKSSSQNGTSNSNIPANHGENQSSSSQNVTSNCNLPTNHGDNQSSRSRHVTSNCNLPIKQEIITVFDAENESSSSGNLTPDCDLPIRQKLTSRFDSENESSTSENSTPDCDLPIIQKITSKFAVENEPTMSRNSTQDYNLPIIQKITSRFGVENESSSSTKVTQNNYNPLIKQKIATRFNGGNESSSSRNVTDLQQKITSRFNDENGSSRSKKGTQNNNPLIKQKIASRFDVENESSSSRNVTDLQQKTTSRFNDENGSSRSTKGTQNNNPPFKQKIATRFNDGKESSSSTNVLDVPIKQEVTEVFHGENETSTSNDVTIDCDLQIKHEVLMISDYEYESESSSSDNLGSNLQYVFPSSQQTGSRSVNDFVSSRNEEFLQSVMADKSLMKNGVKQKIEDGWIVADTKDVQPPRMKKCECFYQETFLHPYNVALGPCEDCVIGEKLRSAHKKYVSRWLNSNKPFVPMTLEEVSSTKYIEHWSNCNVKVIGQLAMRSLSLRQRNVAARKLCKEDHDFYLRSVDEDGGPYHVCIDFQMVKRRMPLAGQQIQAYAELRMTPRGEPLLMAMLYRDLHQVDRTMMKSYCHALEQMKTFVPLFVNLKKSGHPENVLMDEEDELNNPILT